MTPQINKIYKVKEGHEGKCISFRQKEGSKYIFITNITKYKEYKDYCYDILDKNKNIISDCIGCFTEDDLEPIEEEKELYNICPMCETRSVENKCPVCVKEKTLDNLEVGDEVIVRDWKKMLEDINELVDNDFGFDLQFDKKEYSDKDINMMRKIILSTYQISHCVYCKSCQNKYKYKISETLSPSEAETLLEEKLGIKVKII